MQPATSPSSPMATAILRQKLIVREKIEVRSVEEGFLGSWHTGRIIGCKDLARLVQYDHLLDDDGSSPLTEWVKVSPIVEGVPIDEILVSGNYRGLIRPLQPLHVLGKWHLHYGQCVDFLYEDAWWEGVIIDHEDGFEERRVFFPDMGDEMVARIEKLRLSRDWDELTGEWKPRGNWLFLELIEEVEKDWPLPVSVKQIWYEVSMKDGFEKLMEWTSSGKCIWREIVLQVLCDNIKITVEQLFTELNSSWDAGEQGKSLLEFSEPALDLFLKDEGLLPGLLSLVPGEATFQIANEGILHDTLKSSETVSEQNDHQASISTICAYEQAVSVPNIPLPNPLHTANVDSVSGSSYNGEAPDMSYKSPRKERHSTRRATPGWRLYTPEKVTGAEFCPNALYECSKLHRSKKRPSKEITLNAKKHLLHLGWKIMYLIDKAVTRYRYHSPDGKLFDSLAKVCMNFDWISQELEPESSIIMMSPDICRKSSFCLPEVTDLSLLTGKSLSSTKLLEGNTLDRPIIEPDYCPDAVRKYSSLYEDKCGRVDAEAKLMALKAKKHLSAIGWSLYYHAKESRKETRYASPSGEVFYSLISACKWCINAKALSSSELPPAVSRMGNVNIVPLLTEESVGKIPSANEKTLNLEKSSEISMSKAVIPSVDSEVYETRISRKRIPGKFHGNSGSEVSKRRRKSCGLMNSRSFVNADSPIPGRRSSKRVSDKIESSSLQTPRTILSWLIDNNVVLPRARVYYYNNENGPSLAEGRIAREGIRCNCCRGIFSLCKFEIHVGSTSHRPSARIFLEDGRSLLQCQLQLKKRRSITFWRSESHEVKGRKKSRTNDYICSICHDGGELILCDQCPSSFHTRCLGLKITYGLIMSLDKKEPFPCDCVAAPQEVPGGDWFCRACCCQICGQSGGLGETNGLDRDTFFRICCQCEHKYHDACLVKEGRKDCSRKGYWFCGDTCEQVFSGLRRILGKPFPLGTDNLSWTLLKCVKSESYDLDEFDDEDSVEDYSRLNVALSVMHECFEPVKEPSTRRDLVEDVIFNRWSELKRLNFEGFYTVILEKNEEMISAATVRIYGKTVAEVPLVATRFRYRRLGMCRFLMDELEKKLIDLGVERLVLPAVPSVLNTWTNSFGFSVLHKTERLKFLDYTFLDFQGTTFCHKVLTTDPSPVELSRSTGTRAESCDHVNTNIDIELDGNPSSQDFHGKVVVETEVLVHQSPPSNCRPLKFENLLECPSDTPESKPDGIEKAALKCYKRRRFSSY